MKFALISSLFLSMAVLAGADEPKNWSTSVSPSDELDTKIFSSEGQLGTQHYEAVVLGRDLVANPKWSPESPLPVSLAKMTANARSELQKQFANEQMKISSVAFTHLAIVDQWIVVVEFDGTDYSTQGRPDEKRVPYVVLLDGRVISPKTK